MTATDATGFALADNRTSELAEWDMDALGATLHALREDAFDLTEIGFDVSDLDDILNEKIPVIEGSKELSEDEFSDFDNQCPKCGFEYDNPAT